jgi:hypothetical protein
LIKQTGVILSEALKYISKLIFLFHSPDVKISEEQSDKSGTDPEDSEENFNQADITDYQNYEEIFRPRIRELNRTPEPEDELFQVVFAV